MDIVEQLLYILDIIGTVAFAAAGAMVAINEDSDLLGVVLCGIFTAQGGGLTRDLILGNTPPRMFRDCTDLAIAIGTSLVIFLAVRLLQKRMLAHQATFDQVINIFDALGLAVFVVAGMNVASSCGYGDNAPLTIFCGVCSAVGGGVLRDVVLRRTPFILYKEFYACACLIGAAMYYYLPMLDVPELSALMLAMIAVFVLRMLATVYNWNLPKAITSKEDQK